MRERESAIAYTYAMIVLAIIALSVVMTFLAPMFNGILGFVNTDISNGDISQQTAGAISWNLGWISSAVIICFAVLVTFGVVAAFEIAKQYGLV